jgi:tyrosyl-tRNA synthetase
MYQFWLNTDDADVVDRLKVFTFLTRAEIDEIGRAHDAEPFRRIGQRRVALEVTSLVHGPDAAAAAIAASDALFGQGDLTALDAGTLASALRELPNAELPAGTPVVSALVETGLVASLSEARRAIAQGGVSLDGVKVEDDAALVAGSLPGGVSVLRRGKKTLAGVFVVNAAVIE